MVEKKVNVVTKNEVPFYKYLVDKILDEYTAGDLILAVGISVTAGGLYLKLCRKKH